MHLDENSLDRAKRRLIEMHYRARVGHLGGNLSCIDAMMLVHHEMMRRDDRFILSKGHSAGALYVTLWSLGRLSDDDLDSFHQDDTMLGGHPPARGVPASCSAPAASAMACRWRRASLWPRGLQRADRPRFLPDLRRRMAGRLDPGGG